MDSRHHRHHYHHNRSGNPGWSLAPLVASTAVLGGYRPERESGYGSPPPSRPYGSHRLLTTHTTVAVSTVGITDGLQQDLVALPLEPQVILVDERHASIVAPPLPGRLDVGVECAQEQLSHG